MKKIIAISFVSVLFLSQLGYYWVYRFQQHLLKEEMEAQLLATIPDNELEVFEMNRDLATAQWEEEEKEFFLNGEMYDVAKIKKVDGKLLLYCINDKKEEQLLQHFAKAIKADSNTSKSGKSTIKFQLSDFTITAVDKIIELHTVTTPKTSCLNTTLLSSLKEIKAPPPRV